MILSTQSLGGLNLGNSLSEFGLRIAMRMNSDVECSRILGSNNLAARTLTKKGESIYCPGGLAANNTAYQVAYMSDDNIKRIVSELKANDDDKKEICNKGNDFRVIFNGEEPANIEDNVSLIHPVKSDNDINIYIGSPMSIDPSHSFYTLRHESGYNLLAVGGKEDSRPAMRMMGYSLKQLLYQSSENSRVIVCGKTTDLEVREDLTEVIKQYSSQVRIESEYTSIINRINQITEELQDRMSNNIHSPLIGLFLLNPYKFKEFRIDSMMPSVQTKKLVQLIKDGSEYGIHTFAYFDTYQHYSDVFGLSKLMNDWGVKVELKGEDSFRMWGDTMATNSSLHNSYTAFFDTPESEGRKKIKLYK